MTPRGVSRGVAFSTRPARAVVRRDASPRGRAGFRARLVPWHAGDAAAGMRTRAAHVETLQRTAIVAVAEDRPRREQLVERERAVEDVAADQAELALEIERRQHPATDDARGEIRRVAVHRRDHQVGDLVPRGVPRHAVGQRRIGMLAKQARDVLARRRERVDRPAMESASRRSARATSRAAARRSRRAPCTRATAR